MARPTRQQRRARRREQAEAAARDGVAQRTGARTRQPAQPVAEPPRAPTAPRRGRFIAECWGELRKVDWPDQRQVLTGSVVVIIACAIVGAYLYAADLALKPFVERLLLGR